MQKHTPHPQRVNLAWFVGTGQTRFLQVRIVYLKALAMFAALLLLWAVVSLYLMHSLVRDSAQLQVTLQQSLATLLEYQSRYDSVYETAYNTVPAATPVPIATPVPVAALQPLNVRKVLPNPQLISSDRKDRPLRVKRPLFTATGKEFVLQVRLQNHHKSRTARGTVLARAKLTLSDGTERVLSTDSSKYRIKNHKTQTFSFALPPASAGSIEHIRIEVSDRTNKHTTWLLPIDLPYATDTNLKISKNQGAAPHKADTSTKSRR